MNPTSKKSSMAALASKPELSDILQRNFYSQRTHGANPMLRTPIQSKMHTSKSSHCAPHCTNQYAKEKEKNTTVFTKCHEELLMTMSDCF